MKKIFAKKYLLSVYNKNKDKLFYQCKFNHDR